MTTPNSVAQKAAFLDRDGTIIEDKNYLSDPADVVLLPQAADALFLLRKAGFLLFLFTNQSGVGRGWFTIDAVHQCNERMIALLGLAVPVFTEICNATEHPNEPATYRKPNPRFINECVSKYGLDRSACWMVGDKASDVGAGINARINAALVNSSITVEFTPDVRRFSSLYDFANAVVSPSGLMG